MERVQGVKDIEVSISPSVARFRFDARKTPLQDLIAAVKSAGAKYSARIWVQTDGPREQVQHAIESVEGVRSAGIPDDEGLRLISLKENGKTSFLALLAAVKAVGGTLKDPVIKKK